MKDKIKQVLAEVLEIDINQIGDNFDQNDCVKWDSLHHLNLVVELETAFDVDLEPEEIGVMTSINEIMSIINKKQD